MALMPLGHMKPGFLAHLTRDTRAHGFAAVDNSARRGPFDGTVLASIGCQQQSVVDNNEAAADPK